jgi:DNA-binding HxlR family transcriptional regulator
MDINELVKITSKAWSLTILSLIHSGVPARQAPLLTASGATRTAFAQSLAHLADIGMVERNPGHGHPLRPEYRLTERGTRAAQLASRIQLLAHTDDQPLLRRTWTIPILTCLHKPSPYNEIKKALPLITDRALSMSLQSMQDHRWIERHVNQAQRPPRSVYHSVNNGEKISQTALADLSFS